MFDFNSKNNVSATSKLKTACIGKIPCSNEFIKINMNEEDLIVFENWLKEGVSHMARTSYVTEYSVKKEFKSHVFIVYNKESHSAITGCIQQSSDLSGRDYPVSIVASHKNITYPIGFLPYIYRDYINLQKEILESSSDFKSEKQMSDILNNIDDDKYDVSGDVEISLIIEKFKNMDMSELCDRIFSRMGTLDVLRVFSFLRVLLKSISRRTVQRINWGLMLPISPNEDNFIVAFWLMLANSFRDIDKCSTTFYWSFGEQPSLKLFFSPIQPSYLGGVLFSGNSTNIFSNVVNESKCHVIDKDLVVSGISVFDFFERFSGKGLHMEASYELSC